jgi:hypothetical protein
VLALLSGGQARSQSPPPAPPAVSAVALNGPAVPPAPEFCQDGSGCQGPVGGNGPIGWETYLRSGVSLPFGGGVLARALNPGWVIQGGARSLFFNAAQDAAWTADFSVSNICSSADGGTPVLLNITNPDTGGPQTVAVTMNNLNRTYANLALGREWYLTGAAGDCQNNWRAGFDVGGRWGSGKLDLNEIRHRTAMFTGFFLAAHTDVEIPWGSCLLYVGVRAEWGYSFSHILQDQNNGDIQEVILLGTLGIRF